MNASPKEHPFLDEFSHFTRFWGSLWGILSGISVFFPLSNVLLKAIPLGYIADDSSGALEFLSPALITTLVTVATLFIIVQAFRQRHHLRTSKQKDAMQRQAWISFAFGILVLLLYLVTTSGCIQPSTRPLDIWSGAPRRLIGDFLLLIFYGIFFSLLTRAFVLLGMVEYFGKTRK